MQLRADEYPRDTAGTTTLEIRYSDANREDDLYIYVPSIRRVRRAPPTQRCATIAPSEFNFDDINNFNAKVADFNYRLLGRTKMLGNLVSGDASRLNARAGTICRQTKVGKSSRPMALRSRPRIPVTVIPERRLYFDTLTLGSSMGNDLGWQGKLLEGTVLTANTGKTCRRPRDPVPRHRGRYSTCKMADRRWSMP